MGKGKSEEGWEERKRDQNTVQLTHAFTHGTGPPGPFTCWCDMEVAESCAWELAREMYMWNAWCAARSEGSEGGKRYGVRDIETDRKESSGRGCVMICWLWPGSLLSFCIFVAKFKILFLILFSNFPPSTLANLFQHRGLFYSIMNLLPPSMSS